MPSKRRAKRLEEDTPSKHRQNYRGEGKRLRGASRMRSLGYQLVQVWLDPEEMRAIRGRHPQAKLASLLRRLACEDAGITFLQR